MTISLDAECSQCKPAPQARPRMWTLLAALFLMFFAQDGAANGLSDGDQHHLKRAIAFALDDDWSNYERLTTLIEDPLARRYLQWRRLLSADDELGHAPLIEFIETQPHWPATGELQAVAERMLDSRVDFAARRAFFAKRRPLTKEGKLALAEALHDAGDAEGAAPLIREAWIGENFGTTEIRRIRALFKQFLRTEDHVARLDRLLWDDQWTSAEAMLPLVSKERQAWARARIKLQRFQGGVDSALAAVPRRLRLEPGLAYDRLHWRRRKGLDDGVLELLLSPPADLGRGQAWWYERAIQIREKLDKRQFFEAARLAKAHGQTTGLANAEAEWMAGWLSLRFLDEPKTAFGRFAPLFDRVNSPISKGRAGYWAGRAAAAAGDQPLAQQWYGKAAAYSTSFYGQEAARELGQTPQINFQPLPPPAFTQPWSELSDVASMLCEIDEGDAAIPFLRHLALETDLAAPTMAVAASCGRPDIVVELGKFAIRAGVADPLWSFPVLQEVLARVDPALAPLAMAVSRQESHFDSQARSGAGAEGLMQLMPATAKAMGRKAGIRSAEQRLRREPGLNIQLGTTYLTTLLERFDGNLAMVAAGYNAGPSRVNRWIERHGDPRTMSRYEQLDWMELIPFSETRNYVQRVLEGHQIYANLLSNSAGIQLALHEPLGQLVPPMRPRPKPR